MEGSQATAPGTPRPFGKYELLSLLGTGGMAEVFLARAGGPRDFERLLVIKRILPHFSVNEEFVSMFVEEAKLSAALYHGNIVQVFEFGEIDEQLFLAMEFVDGTDLRTVTKNRGGALPPHVAAYVAMQTLQALEYAHTRLDHEGQPLGIVHRDVTPANILLSRGGEVKLCDFGIARVSNRHTASGSIKGKFGYVSPEQVYGEPAGPRSDLFSVGVVLWEMLAGARLFVAENDVATLEKVRAGEIPELNHLTGTADRRLRGVVRRALQREPSRRHVDAATFAAELRQYIVTAGAGDPVAAVREMVAATPRVVPPLRPASRSGVVPTRAAAPSAAVEPRPPVPAMPVAPPMRPAAPAPPPAAPPFPSAPAAPAAPAPSPRPVAWGTAERPPPDAIARPPDVAPVPEPVPEPEVRDTLPPDEVVQAAAASRRRWIVLAVSAVLIAALGVALFVVSRRLDDAPRVRPPESVAVQRPANPSSEVPAPPPPPAASSEVPAPAPAVPAPSEVPAPLPAEQPAPDASAAAAAPARAAPVVPPRRTGPPRAPGAPPPTKEKLIDPFALGSSR